MKERNMGREIAEGVEEHETRGKIEGYEDLAAIIPGDIIKAAGRDIANIHAMHKAQEGGVWDTFEQLSQEESAEGVSFPKRMEMANKKATKSHEEIAAELREIGSTDSADSLIEKWIKTLPPEQVTQIAALAQPDMPYYDSNLNNGDEGLAWVAIRALARNMGIVRYP